jgi:hypothetical protein
MCLYPIENKYRHTRLYEFANVLGTESGHMLRFLLVKYRISFFTGWGASFALLTITRYILYTRFYIASNSG